MWLEPFLSPVTSHISSTSSTTTSSMEYILFFTLITNEYTAQRAAEIGLLLTFVVRTYYFRGKVYSQYSIIQYLNKILLGK